MRPNFRSLAARLCLMTVMIGGAPLAFAEPPATRPVKPSPKAPPAPPGIRVERDLKYGDAPGAANLLDIYLPAEAPASPRPLIVWVHGGGWEGGDKTFGVGAEIARRGYVVASLNYRLSSEAIFPAQIQDCKGAIRWLRAHATTYHIDPNRVGAFGASAGGHLVALLGTAADAKDIEGTVGGNLDQSSRVQAVCDWFGPTDMSRFFEQDDAEKIPHQPPEVTAIARLFGGAPDRRKELVAQANPLTYVSKHAPPFLIMHGDKDKLVPVGQSRILADALTAAGVECHLEVLEGAGHGDGFSEPRVLKMVSDFFDSHLQPEAPAHDAPAK